MMRILLLCVVSLLGACAHSPSYDPQDPLERVNRAVYGFNETVDQYVAQPVAKGYVAVVPGLVRTGISNFFSNLTYPNVILNSALQGKFKQAGLDTARFLVNTTFGAAGFIDSASTIGLERNSEDFGQTLGHWGVGQGWFLMLPFLGPTTNRDMVGRVADIYANPASHLDDDTITYSLAGLGLVSARAQLLGTEGMLEQQFDRYAFIRGLYLQRRESQVYDGNPPKEKFDFDDEDEAEGSE